MRDPIPFGKYVLLERISVGGMAEVFKAKSFGVEGFEKILAIKRILPSLAEDGDFIDMFIDEAKICGQLNHANICQIFELGRVQDSHFIAMEYVWGKDLLQMQNRFRKLRQTMKPEMAAYIACKMCEGLDYAHKKKGGDGKPLNIIHRDISPQNILASYEGELKIIDFGIAKAASRSSRTQAGVLKGKFGYMSPEQVRGLPLDRRSDVFSIGTILYELLIADRLFVGESDFETLERVRNVDVPPPSQRVPNCPPELDAAIMKAIAKDPEDRFQWAGEMQELLQAFLMAREPVFAAKNLSQWMREQFAVEYKREQDILEEQRKVGREILGAAAPPRSSSAPRPSPLGSAPSPSSAPRPITQSIASGPRPLAAQAQAKAAHVPVSLPTPSGSLNAEELFAGTEDPGLFAEKTSITAPSFGEASGAMEAQPSGGASQGELPAQSTVILSGSNPQVELPAVSTRIIDGGTGSRPLPSPKTTSGASTMLQETPPEVARLLAAQAAARNAGPSVVPSPSLSVSTSLSHATPPSAQPVVVPNTGQVVSPLPLAQAARPRSNLWKDVAIGVGVALLVFGGFLGGRAFFGKGASKGTLVVVVQPARAAEVLVDGASRGKLESGVPLTLKDLPEGTHNVVVRASDGAEDKQTVMLASGDVRVITATLVAPVAAAAPAKEPAAPSMPAMGRLNLQIPAAAADGNAEVYVDGAQLPPGEWKKPIPLRAETSHEVRITRPGSREAKLSVTLKSGEEVTKEIDLAAALGKINVVTDPVGAEVSLNGKKMGQSPLNIADLDGSKPVRMTVRLKGYAPITKNVNFEKGLEQTFEMKMVASSDDGFNEAEGKPEKTAKAEKQEKAEKIERIVDKSEKSTKETKEKPFAMVQVPPAKETKPAAAAKESKPPALIMDPDAIEPGEKPKKGDKSSAAAAAAGSEPGYLVANTQPWAKVFIDGKDTGKTTPIAPRSKIPLKPGKHVVTFVANGKKFNFDVVIKPAEDTRLIKQLTDTP